MKFGEIDAKQILENEFRIGVLERIIDAIVAKNPTINGINKEELEEIRHQVVESLKQKYPNSGLEYKKS